MFWVSAECHHKAFLGGYCGRRPEFLGTKAPQIFKRYSLSDTVPPMSTAEVNKGNPKVGVAKHKQPLELKFNFYLCGANYVTFDPHQMAHISQVKFITPWLS